MQYQRQTASERKDEEIGRWKYRTVFTGENRAARRARLSWMRHRGRKYGRGQKMQKKSGWFNGFTRLIRPFARVFGQA